MRLLIVTQSLNSKNPLLGFFVFWVKEFAKNFSFVTVICLEKGECDLPNNVKVLSLGKEEGKSRLKHLLRFYRYIWQERASCDVVFVHMNPIYVILGGIFWRVWGKKIGLWYTHKHVDLKLKMATLFSHIIFSASKESFRLNTKKLIVTGHGIPTDLFPKSVRSNIGSPLKLIIAGRVSPIKQIEKAIYILKELNSILNTTLTIAGGPTNTEDELYLDKVRLTVQRTGVADRVHYLGHIPFSKMFSILKEHDIMLHTSQTGSLDKVVLEALLSSVLVITENESFKSDFQDIGMFVGGEVEQFVEKIKILQSSPLLQNEARKFGFEWVIRNHSLTNLIPKIRVVYDNVSTTSK